MYHIASIINFARPGDGVTFRIFCLFLCLLRLSCLKRRCVTMPSQPIPSVFRQPRSEPITGSSSSRPLTLSELSQLATSGANQASLIIDSTIPIQRYIIGSETLTKQAETFLQDENLDDAFISLVKNCKLLIEALPLQHRGYKTLDVETKQRLKESGQWHLDQLSQVKSKIVDRFEIWRSQYPDATLDNDAETRRKVEERERKERLRPVPSTGVMESSPQQALPVPSIEYVKPPRGDHDFGLDVRNQISRAMPSPFTTSPYTHSHTPQQASPSRHRIEYPTLRPASSIRMNSHQVSQGFAPRSEQTYQYYQIQSSLPREQPLAPRPLPIPSPMQSPLSFNYPAISNRHSHGSSQPSQQYTNSIDQEAKRLLHTDHASKMSVRGATTEGGEPLRTLIIPSSLISTFVSIADKNTRANLETCGLLMGTMDSNMLQVHHLLIPKQSASSDRCDTEDEEGIWNFMESRGLVTLGWCHTHPQQ
jgi:STAM-binding protein